MRWGGTHSVQMGVGIGVQGGRGLCSPLVRSSIEYLMLVYSRPLILLFCKDGNKGGRCEETMLAMWRQRPPQGQIRGLVGLGLYKSKFFPIEM